MYGRYVTFHSFKHDHIPDSNRLLFVIGEEQQVTPIECGLHAPTVIKHTVYEQNNNNNKQTKNPKTKQELSKYTI